LKKHQGNCNIIILDERNSFIEFAVFIEETLSNFFMFGNYDVSTNQYVAKQTMLIEFYDSTKKLSVDNKTSCQLKSVFFGRYYNYLVLKSTIVSH
jgi:hypothetical protein